MPNEVMNKLFVGMDLHKSTPTFCAKDKDENVFKEAKLLTDRNQIRTFMKFLPGAVSVALEPVSQWYTYADLLQGKGGRCPFGPSYAGESHCLGADNREWQITPPHRGKTRMLA